MDRYEQVLQDCRRVGIRTATYFSNKELHPSTREFQEHSQQWGRMNRKGDLQHNYFRGQSEFGAQMCLRSGWLGLLKQSIDRVLKNHPLDGVYYDWNVALLCYNPVHEGKDVGAPAQGHWDMDELLDLIEWTRQRVGPRGLVIVHNTTTPMFAPLGDLTIWQFADWRNSAITLSDRRCASAVYSRPGEAYLLVANLEPTTKEAGCVLHPEKLPYPLAPPRAASKWTVNDLAEPLRRERAGSNLDVQQLVGEGIKIAIPCDEAILIRVR